MSSPSSIWVESTPRSFFKEIEDLLAHLYCELATCERLMIMGYNRCNGLSLYDHSKTLSHEIKSLEKQISFQKGVKK